MQAVVVVVVGFMIVSVLTIGVAARSAFDHQTQRNISISKVSSDEFQTADLNKVQKDDRVGQLKTVGAIGEAALGAQSLAAPGVSPNPIGIGVSEGMSLGGWAVSAAERNMTGDAGSGTAAGDAGSGTAPGDSTTGDSASSGQGALLGQGGVDLATAPDEYYVGWYYVEDGTRYVMVSEVGYYRDYVGSGGVEAPAKKYSLTMASWGYNEVMFWIADNVTSWKGGGNVGVINGVEYDFRMGMSPDIYMKYGQ